MDEIFIFFEIGMVRLFALFTKPPGQALGDNAQQSVGKIINRNPHVDNARYGFRGAVRMQRAENQMAGQRRFQRDFGGLRVAHFADHDHVGIGPQERPERFAEREADFAVHLHLLQAGLLDFHGIFRRPDGNLRLVDMAEGRMQRGRFSGSGGTDAQHDALRLCNHIFKSFQIVGRKSELPDGHGF